MRPAITIATLNTLNASETEALDGVVPWVLEKHPTYDVLLVHEDALDVVDPALMAGDSGPLVFVLGSSRSVTEIPLWAVDALQLPTQGLAPLIESVRKAFPLYRAVYDLPARIVESPPARIGDLRPEDVDLGREASSLAHGTLGGLDLFRRLFDRRRARHVAMWVPPASVLLAYGRGQLEGEAAERVRLALEMSPTARQKLRGVQHALEGPSKTIPLAEA